MWYCFTLNGQMEIIMLTLKQIKAGRVNEIVLGKHPTATDIREATDDKVSAVIQRVRGEEKARDEALKIAINSHCPCCEKQLDECDCEG